MDAKSSYPPAAHIAGTLAFLVVLYFADWATHAVSLVLFRVDPSSVPDSFFIVYQPALHDPSSNRYNFTTWRQYLSAEDKPAIRTLRLAEPRGRVRIKGTWLQFRVLEDDGQRQLVEVEYDGAYHSRSRYEALPDRAVPVAFRSRGWGDAVSTHAAGWLVGVLLAGLAAWLAVLGVDRLLRPQPT